MEGKRVKPNDLIKKATFNLNNTRSVKYDYAPQHVENKSLDITAGKDFQEVYDFYRLVRIKEPMQRPGKYAKNLNNCKKKRLRDPLDIGEKVLVLPKRKKMLQVNYIRVLQKIDHF